MSFRKIKPGVHSVGAIDWDRRLFDELIPLPDGTSYNSYLIQGGDKTALIDGVDPTKEAELIANLRELNVETIDYIVANHAERDHSGAIPAVLDVYPAAKVAANAKCIGILKELHGIADDRFIAVEDRQTLPLGKKTLEFIFAPWVHWPETILTFLREDRILFTCDFFGSHLATSDLFVTDEARTYIAAKRYYAEIMMPFRRHIQRHLERLGGFQFDMIAPSHGPLYDRPEKIVEAYDDWTGDAVKNQAVIVYVSMHGSTRRMVDYLINALMRRGVGVKPFNLTGTDLGELAISLVDAATLVVASPTVLGGAHPAAAYAAVLAGALKPKLKVAAIIGSFGWAGQMVEQLTGLLAGIKAENLEPVMVKGLPCADDFKLLDRLASEIADKHIEFGAE